MLNIQHTARALAPSMASPALVNMIRARGSWEAEHVKAPAGNAQVALQVDPRFYPKSHDQYDLASLNMGGPFIVTPLDVRKEHLPMLTAFQYVPNPWKRP